MKKVPIRNSNTSTTTPRPTTGAFKKFVDSESLSAHLSEELGDRIHQRAYEKWEAAGRPKGDGTDFWLAAELELTKPR